MPGEARLQQIIIFLLICSQLCLLPYVLSPKTEGILWETSSYSLGCNLRLKHLLGLLHFPNSSYVSSDFAHLTLRCYFVDPLDISSLSLRALRKQALRSRHPLCHETVSIQCIHNITHFHCSIQGEVWGTFKNPRGLSINYTEDVIVAFNEDCHY